MKAQVNEAAQKRIDELERVVKCLAKHLEKRDQLITQLKQAVNLQRSQVAPEDL